MKFFTNPFKNRTKATLILDANGMHRIGGKAIDELQIPELESSPIVYFGCLSHEENLLGILDFDLHLICPMFLDLVHPVFFDHSIPNAPKLIRNGVNSNFEQLFEDIHASDYFEFEEKNFRFDFSKPPKMNSVYKGEIGFVGKPDWIQQPTWPTSPVNHKKMTFLFQLGDVDECKVVKGAEVLSKEYIDPYLHFGHGYLYVFYEPESKVVAYIAQTG